MDLLNATVSLLQRSGLLGVPIGIRRGAVLMTDYPDSLCGRAFI